MSTTTNAIGQNVAKVIADLRDRGIKKIAILLRHSLRHYDDADPSREPFLDLTGEGKDLCYELGKNLPTDSLIRFFSSPVSRCVETAYQVEKGNIYRGGKTETNIVRRELESFFLKDLLGVLAVLEEVDAVTFFRSWFNNEVSRDLMDEPKAASEKLLNYLVGKLAEDQGDHIDIHASHDWSLQLMKEYFLDAPMEKVGEAEYLEGVVLYKEGDDFYITNHQIEAKRLDCLGYK